MDIKKLSPKEFKAIYSKAPRLCIDLVVKTKKGIILTKRTIPIWKGFWHTPGSTVFFKETLEHAVKRTAKQELNLDISIEKLLGVMECLCKTKNYPAHNLSVFFLVKPKDNALKNIRLDNQASEWKEFKILPKRMISAQRKFLQDKLF